MATKSISATLEEALAETKKMEKDYKLLKEEVEKLRVENFKLAQNNVLLKKELNMWRNTSTPK